MSVPKRKEKKWARLEIKLTEYEKNKMKILADHYAQGNLSEWLRWAGLNAERTFLTSCKKKKGR
jgi:hypothetical protein